MNKRQSATYIPPDMQVYAAWIEGRGYRDSPARRKAFQRGWYAAMAAVTRPMNDSPGSDTAPGSQHTQGG